MVDRTVAPKFVEPKKFKLPNPETIHFENGSRFFFLKAGNQPVVRLEFIFRAGAWFETAPGVAYFTGKMLTEGTTSFTSKDIAERLDQYGAYVEVHPGFDYTNLSIHIATFHLEKIIPILDEILFSPSFQDHEFELMKQIQIQQLSINEQKNDFVASRLFRSKLYGNFPYGNVMKEEIIKNTSINELKDHYERWINGRFDLVMTGDFDLKIQDSIIRFLENKLHKIHDFDPKECIGQDHFSEYIEKEASLQSSIFMGKRSLNRKDERFGQLLLLNEVFGGYFGSRLMQNIREDKGFTYGIHSHFVTLKNDAYFVINSDVKKENKDQTVSEINREIDRLKNELIKQEELSEVKNYLKGSILNTLTTPFALTDKLKNIFFYDLDSDYYEKLFDDIDAATSQDLLNLANSTLFDKSLSSIIVG